VKILQPKRDRLILEHRPWVTFAGIFVVVALLITWSFGRGLETGLVVSLGCAGYAWFASRRFEQLRVVFDAQAGRVDIHRRTGRDGASAASYALDEIGGVEAATTGEGKYTKYQLVLVIPAGPHAGRHPLNAFEIPDRNGPELAMAINSWLRHTQ